MTIHQTTATEPKALDVTGRKRDRKVVEMPEYFAFARRILRATSRRVADRDIEALAGLQSLRDEIDAEMAKAVDGLRTVEGGDYSWSEIGRVLGITRQAAQQRFGKKGC